MPAGWLSMVRKHPLGWESNRKSVGARVAAVVAVLTVLAIAGSPKGAAGYYRIHYPKYAAQVKQDLNSFCMTHYNNFKQYGTVATRKHKGRPPKVPDDVALKASETFKAGKVIKAYPSAEAKKKVDVHVWWTSIKVACQENDYLGGLCVKYNIRPKQLLKRMKAVDPNLVRRRIDVKMDLTDQQKAKRKAAAKRLYKLFQDEPDVLSRIYFVDECKIWMSNLAGGAIKVYCDAHDANVHAVLPCKWMRKGQDNKPVKLHFVCAVNAVHGAVYCKFTTGTTDNIDHVGNPNAPYYVSVCCY